MKAEYLEEKDIDAEESIDEMEYTDEKKDRRWDRNIPEEPTNHRKSSALSKNLSVLFAI